MTPFAELLDQGAILQQCRFCGCSEHQPCVIRRTGETCAWVTHDLCDFCARKRMPWQTAQFLMLAELAHEIGTEVSEWPVQMREMAREQYESLPPPRVCTLEA